MGWERTKATTTALPTALSLVVWLLTGLAAVIAGVLLFVLHASGMVKTMATMNIWWLAFGPILVWLFLLCLRGWIWSREVDKYHFLQSEAQQGQRQWEVWAGRHLAVLGSCILLPSGVTAATIAKSENVNAVQHLSLVCHFEDKSVTDAQFIKMGLAGVQTAVKGLPASLPLNVTFVTDNISTQLETLFSQVWKDLYPERSVPAVFSVNETFPFTWIEERLRQPVLDIELILIIQKNGRELYSDALAAILLTSDDMAQKYQLSHPARILRPMPLNMDRFREEISLFLETQSIASQTVKIFCDSQSWNTQFADVMEAALAHQIPWKPEEIEVMEKYHGIPGATSAWLLTALLSDVVAISKAPILGLFTSGKDHFVSTIIAGSENNDVG